MLSRESASDVFSASSWLLSWRPSSWSTRWRRATCTRLWRRRSRSCSSLWNSTSPSSRTGAIEGSLCWPLLGGRSLCWLVLLRHTATTGSDEDVCAVFFVREKLEENLVDSVDSPGGDNVMSEDTPVLMFKIASKSKNC